SRIWFAGILGILCLTAQLLLWFLPQSRDMRVLLYVVTGIPLIFGGWCLMAPAVVILCERVGAYVMGFIFAVRPSLLRNAWSRTPWRAGAMIAALMIGVTLFTTVRARGESIMTSWITPKIPDLVAKSIRTGFSKARLDRLSAQHPELRDMATFEYFDVHIKVEPTTLGNIIPGDKITFIAVDPHKFASLVEMDFEQGEREAALKELEDGRHVFVTTEFYNVRKLGKGDKITLTDFDGKDVEFTISAVVRSTGVEMVKNYFDLRASFGEKSVSSALGTIPDAIKYFKLGDPTLILMNVDQAHSQPDQMARLRDDLTVEGLQSLSSVEIKQTLHRIILRIMNGLSIVGLGALCVASLGVANMVIASIHARRYEFGVLRAIGAGRWQLIRMVLAEVTLIGMIAGILGAGAGLWFAYMASQLDWVVIGFATNFISPDLASRLLFAVLLVATAIGLTTLLAWLASIVPAIRGAMTAQRTLLASGRV
ncbi:MAG TPA: ABC transporter permease, partial [Phycisphaerae bacterium]